MKRKPNPNVNRPDLDAPVDYVSMPHNIGLGHGDVFKLDQDEAYQRLNAIHPVVGPSTMVIKLYDLCLVKPRLKLSYWNRIRHPVKCALEVKRRLLIKNWLKELRKWEELPR